MYFTIANEYAFDTFGIQLCPYFLWHMSKCNTTKNMQITYGSLKVYIYTKPLLVSCWKLP